MLGDPSQGRGPGTRGSWTPTCSEVADRQLEADLEIEVRGTRSGNKSSSKKRERQQLWERSWTMFVTLFPSGACSPRDGSCARPQSAVTPRASRAASCQSPTLVPGPLTSRHLALGLLPPCTLSLHLHSSSLPYLQCGCGSCFHPLSALPLLHAGPSASQLLSSHQGLPAAGSEPSASLCSECSPWAWGGSAICMRLLKSCRVPFPVKQRSLPRPHP